MERKMRQPAVHGVLDVRKAEHIPPMLMSYSVQAVASLILQQQWHNNPSF